MDTTAFENQVSKLRKGEYVRDPSVFEYASNGLYETKRLLEAYRTCCALQAQKIELLRHMNKELMDSLKRAREASND